ncbi:nesprin-1-like [Ptychodera flava]|uniref:nesprin-1-like n=1 Tax=Ptychodera flava TaxID=63121 RepID=UPI00396A6D9A
MGLGDSAGSMDSLSSTDGPSPAKKKAPADPKAAKGQLGAKKALLKWAQRAASKSVKVEVKDFGKSWRDGYAFNAMIHSINPDLIDMDGLPRKTNVERLDNAFSVAEKDLGIPKLLDPKDVDVDKPDERSIMTYVAQFLQQYPEVGDDESSSLMGSVRDMHAVAQEEEKLYQDIMDHLSKAEATLTMAREGKMTKLEEYEKQQELNDLHEQKKKNYALLLKKFEGKALVSITEEKITVAREKWERVTKQLASWKRAIDNTMPKALIALIKWMDRAEAELKKEPQIQQDKVEESAKEVRQKLAEHRQCFKDSEQVKATFKQMNETQQCEKEKLTPEQLGKMAARLDYIFPTAKRKESKLQYQELKYALLSFVVIAEKHLKSWTIKYGRQDAVEAMFKNYTDFVEKGKFFQKYETGFQQLQAVAEAYFNGISDGEEKASVRSFVTQQGTKMKNLSVEIHSVQSMLEKVIQNWATYNEAVEELQAWLEKAEKVLTQSHEARKDFFKNLPTWMDKHTVLNDSGNFLIEVCQEEVSFDIKQQLLLLNRRWKDIFEQGKIYMKEEEAERLQREYAAGLKTLTIWLDKSEKILLGPVECTYKGLKDHAQDLDEIREQEQANEEIFKQVSKTAQALVKSCSPERVESMLHTLKLIKQRIVKIRDQVPVKQAALGKIIPLVQQWESGIDDLESWMNEADRLLRSHVLDSSRDRIQARLEQHQAFFRGAPQFAKLIENKEKLCKDISKTHGGAIDTSQLENKMSRLQSQFKDTVTSAENWEKKFTNSLELWDSYDIALQNIDGWLETAQSVLLDKNDTTECLIQKHLKFFDNIDPEILQSFLRACKELLHTMQDEDRPEIRQKMSSVQTKWKDIMYQAPIRLIKLRFKLAEDDLLSNVDLAEKELASEEDDMKGNKQMELILQEHLKFFHETNFFESSIQCVQDMESLSNQLAAYRADDTSLQELHTLRHRQWQELCNKIDDVHRQLQSWPEQWKDYYAKFNAVSKWMDSVDESVTSLKKAAEYDEFKVIHKKFQAISEEVKGHQSEIQWLVDRFAELAQGCTEEERNAEDKKLNELLERQKHLLPRIEIVKVEAKVIEECFEYQTVIKTTKTWLRKKRKKMSDVPPSDSLDKAKQQVKEHEVLVGELDNNKEKVQEEIKKGKELVRHESAPSFVSQDVSELEEEWHGTSSEAQQKEKELQGSLSVWEDYEKQKGAVLEFLDKAEQEVERKSQATGLESLRPELAIKEGLHNKQLSLSQTMGEVKAINAKLQDIAPEDKIATLHDEMLDMEKRYKHLNANLAEQVAALRKKEADWLAYYERLGKFADWLDNMEKKFDAVTQAEGTPEEHFNKAKVMFSEIYDKYEDLENLEKDGKDLANGFKTKETSALKRDLSDLRSRWEDLCSKAKAQSTQLADNVTHWQLYQSSMQQLLPWLERMEAKVAEETTNCASPTEVQALSDEHDAVRKDIQENRQLMATIENEARQVPAQHDITEEVNAVKDRWQNLLTNVDNKERTLQDLLAQWTKHNEDLDNFLKNLEKIEKIAKKEDLDSASTPKLESLLATFKVREKSLKKLELQMLIEIRNSCGVVFTDEIVTLEPQFTN